MAPLQEVGLDLAAEVPRGAAAEQDVDRGEGVVDGGDVQAVEGEDETCMGGRSVGEVTRELEGWMAGCGSQVLQGRVRELGAAGQGAGARGCTGLRGGSTGEVRREPGPGAQGLEG